MTGSAKTLTACTLGGLVVATGYTVALGGSGLLWLAWTVLGLVTVGVFLSRGA
ncbi:hypothetical protein [Streptomyces oceani]|uniref:hypothetical protein n=1 Tax=Streptomyces oceani TaxID=1075402 RepID=UPI00147FE1FD|nr:hypothetical protein [Streptomyces oceani]